MLDDETEITIYCNPPRGVNRAAGAVFGNYARSKYRGLPRCQPVANQTGSDWLMSVLAGSHRPARASLVAISQRASLVRTAGRTRPSRPYPKLPDLPSSLLDSSSSE